MIQVNCPFCGNSKFERVINCKDYTVSHETFSLVACPNCNLILTSPRPAEDKIGRYYQSNDYISHTNSSKNIVEILYRIARAYTLKWKTKLVKKYSVSSPHVLDYGCGTGSFLRACYDEGFTITGIEPSITARENADNKIKSHIGSSLFELSNEKYDIICLWHVLEHLDQPLTVITELQSRLNTNGTIFIAVPNHKSDDAMFYKEHWAGYDVPRHYWHFTQGNIKMLAEKLSLKIVETKAMRLDSYYVSMLSEKYRNPNKKFASLFSGFLRGLISNMRARKTSEYSSLLYILKKR